jgi:hypothetical protein
LTGRVRVLPLWKPIYTLMAPATVNSELPKRAQDPLLRRQRDRPLNCPLSQRPPSSHLLIPPVAQCRRRGVDRLRWTFCPPCRILPSMSRHQQQQQRHWPCRALVRSHVPQFPLPSSIESPLSLNLRNPHKFRTLTNRLKHHPRPCLSSHLLPPSRRAPPQL